LLPGVEERIKALSALIDVHVLTADTYGTAKTQLAVLPIELRTANDGDEKARYVSSLGPLNCVTIGNGINDIGMSKRAVLSVGVVGPEGLSGALARVASIIVLDITDALELLINPVRLVATLRR
jgi:soluble P-type ATPase